MSYPLNQAITYTAVGSTPGTVDTFSYAWVFDDLGTGIGNTLPHTWTTIGPHLSTVVATDLQTGGNATASKSINVKTLGNWIAISFTPNGQWGSIAWGNGRFVACKSDGSSGTGKIMYSTDGTTWVLANAPDTIAITCITYSVGLFVALGTNYCITSPDGITWTQRFSGVANRQWISIVYGNGVFVALSYLNGVTGQCMTSPDGITWTPHDTAFDGQWYALAFGNGLFVAGSTTNAMVSTNGITWSTSVLPTTTTWTKASYSNGVFLLANQYYTMANAFATSTDGVAWTLRDLPSPGFNIRSISSGDGIFVATCSGANHAWSADGIAWFLNISATMGAYDASVYSPSLGMFVAVAYNSSGGSNGSERLVW